MLAGDDVPFRLQAEVAQHEPRVQQQQQPQ
jgi:hypothetical protein